MADITSLLTQDAISLFLGDTSPQWGIYQGGSPVVVADSVKSFEYRQDYQVADFPVEQGAFQSYDKVQRPFDVRLRFSSSGSSTSRQALLDSIAAISGDTNVYDAVTPDAIYQSVNVDHYDYRFTEGKPGLLIIDVWCIQIMASSPPSSQNSASPSAASPVNGGTVQASPATPSQSSLVLSEIPGS